MSTVKNGNIDAVLEALGPLGRYTIFQYCLLLLTVWATAFNTFSIVFTGQHNQFRCPGQSLRNLNQVNTSSDVLEDINYLNNTTYQYGSTCNARKDGISKGNITHHNLTLDHGHCTAFDVEFSSPNYLSFVSEFNLVCEREYLVGMTQTIMTVGFLIGALVFPYFTDKYGRKPILISCSCLSLLSSIGLTWASSYEMYVVFKLLNGVFVQGLECAGVNAILEIQLTRYRAFMFTFLGCLNWTFSCLLLAPISYLFRHSSWRYIEGTLAGFNLCLVILIFFLDEPLRWLAVNERIESLHGLMRKAARWNNVDYNKVASALHSSEDTKVAMLDITTEIRPEKMLSEEHAQKDSVIVRENSDHPEEPMKREHLNFSHLFIDPMLRKHTLFSILAWFFNSLIYYALVLMSSTLHGSLYVSYTLNALVEVPQSFYCYLYLDKVGRRKSFSMFSAIAGVSLIAVAFVWKFAPEQQEVITALSILGKFGISGSFNIIYLYTPELFPTNLRNTGVGVAYLSARVGGMLSPYAELLMKTLVYAPGLVFGLSSLFLAITPYMLPETAHKQLPQTLAEMKLWRHAKTETNDKDKNGLATNGHTRNSISSN